MSATRPLAIGDEVTPANIGQLPHLSVIAYELAVWIKLTDRWYGSVDQNGHLDQEMLCGPAEKPKVLRVGRGAVDTRLVGAA